MRIFRFPAGTPESLRKLWRVRDSSWSPASRVRSEGSVEAIADVSCRRGAAVIDLLEESGALQELVRRQGAELAHDVFAGRRVVDGRRGDDDRHLGELLAAVGLAAEAAGLALRHLEL